MVAGTILLAKVLFFVKHCKQQKTVPLQQFQLLDSDSGFCDNPTKSKSQICSWQTRNLQKKSRSKEWQRRQIETNAYIVPTESKIWP